MHLLAGHADQLTTLTVLAPSSDRLGRLFGQVIPKVLQWTQVRYRGVACQVEKSLTPGHSQKASGPTQSLLCQGTSSALFLSHTPSIMRLVCHAAPSTPMRRGRMTLQSHALTDHHWVGNQKEKEQGQHGALPPHWLLKVGLELQDGT